MMKCKMGFGNCIGGVVFFLNWKRANKVIVFIPHHTAILPMEISSH